MRATARSSGLDVEPSQPYVRYSMLYGTPGRRFVGIRGTWLSRDFLLLRFQQRLKATGEVTGRDALALGNFGCSLAQIVRSRLPSSTRNRSAIP